MNHTLKQSSFLEKILFLFNLMHSLCSAANKTKKNILNKNDVIPLYKKNFYLILIKKKF